MTEEEKKLYQDYDIEQLNEAFNEACESNNLDVIEYLFNSSDLEENINLKENLSDGFSIACQYGNLSVVRYILNKLNIDRSSQLNLINRGFVISCEFDNIDITEYLLTSPELKEHANIHCNNDLAIGLACEEGYFSIVKYLLTSPELKEHADIHNQNDAAFIWACQNQQEKILDFLIFEYNIKKTTFINVYLESNIHKKTMKDIITLFDKRDLQLKLQEELPTTDKKNKIKL